MAGSNLTIRKIAFIDTKEFKFLGRRLHADCSEQTQRKDIRQLTVSLMQKVDGSWLQDHHKLWLYHHLVVPKLSWSFQALELTQGFVRELHFMCLPFLKKWSGQTLPFSLLAVANALAYVSTTFLRCGERASSSNGTFFDQVGTRA